MSTILFICTGNLCRSPMAEGLMKQKLADRALDAKHQVRSAGTWAVNGRPASENAIAVMKERGIDISDHIARTVTAEDVAEATLILVMTRDHAQMLRNTWPQYDWKVYRLSSVAGKRRDVPDPYQGPMQEYRAVADLIARYLDDGFERILELI